MGSETSKCRGRLSRWCQGTGIDVGFGGDPIIPTAICVDLPRPYTNVGGWPRHVAADARDLGLFADGALDYVYSSHLIEDFTYDEQRGLVAEWLRVLKPGGVVVVYAPNEQRYREVCRQRNESSNEHHQEVDYSGESFLRRVVSGLAVEIAHFSPHVDDYCWEIVLRKPAGGC